jgi:hypothetical protein
MTQEVSNIIHIISALTVVGLVIYVIVNRANLIAALETLTQQESTINGLHIINKSKSNDLMKSDMKVSELTRDNNALLSKMQQKDIEIAKLNSKIDVLYRENKKLLVAASDDVTINVKVADDANIVSENPRPKKKYYKPKSKNNGGSTTNNSQTGKKG